MAHENLTKAVLFYGYVGIKTRPPDDPAGRVAAIAFGKYSYALAAMQSVVTVSSEPQVFPTRSADIQWDADLLTYVRELSMRGQTEGKKRTWYWGVIK